MTEEEIAKICGYRGTDGQGRFLWNSGHRWSGNVREIHGDYNNVVGLPIARLYHELQK